MQKVIGIALLTAQLGAFGCATRAALVPPPARVEVIGVAPRRDAVWVPGHWNRRYGRWHWVNGHWR
jgi:YXWGXW repeat-containing protein